MPEVFGKERVFDLVCEEDISCSSWNKMDGLKIITVWELNTIWTFPPQNTDFKEEIIAVVSGIPAKQPAAYW